MHEECLKDIEGTVDSGYLWRVLKIRWRVGIFLYLNNSEGHIQFFFNIESLSFYNKKIFKRHSMFGNFR